MYHHFVQRESKTRWRNELKQCRVSTLTICGILFSIRTTHYSFGVKVHRSPVVGILNTFNLWILLRKIVEYVVGQTFMVYGLFRCRSWRSYRKLRQSRHVFGKKKGSIRLSHYFQYFHDYDISTIILKTCQIMFGLSLPLAPTLTSL